MHEFQLKSERWAAWSLGGALSRGEAQPVTVKMPPTVNHDSMQLRLGVLLAAILTLKRKRFAHLCDGAEFAWHTPKPLQLRRLLLPLLLHNLHPSTPSILNHFPLRRAACSCFPASPGSVFLHCARVEESLGTSTALPHPPSARDTRRNSRPHCEQSAPTRPNASPPLPFSQRDLLHSPGHPRARRPAVSSCLRLPLRRAASLLARPHSRLNVYRDGTACAGVACG
jgi:hypothetical protein